MTKSLISLSIFFPFFNDAGTVSKAISDAYKYGEQLTNKLEVIALHGGPSKDDTWEEILRQKQIHPRLKIIDKKDNTKGYAVIKYGFESAENDWIFYTDGDLQYSLADLPKLAEKQKETGADVINGFKVDRGDTLLRKIVGSAYQGLSKMLFQLPIRDTDCDFRLIRRSFFKKITLTAYKSSILPEMIKKLQRAGATFAEIPVRHNERSYGRSNYKMIHLFMEKAVGDIQLFYSFLFPDDVSIKQHEK
jgi:glycosyltransferase involved in cell wall biosynthesis